MTKSQVKKLRQRVFLRAQEELCKGRFACHAIQAAAGEGCSGVCPERVYFERVLRPRFCYEAQTDPRFGFESAFYGVLTPDNENARFIGIALVAILAKEGFVP